jgi:hypothetical protein
MQQTACLSNGLKDLSSISKSLPLKIRIIFVLSSSEYPSIKTKNNNSFLIGGPIKCATAFGRA